MVDPQYASHHKKINKHKEVIHFAGDLLNHIHILLFKTINLEGSNSRQLLRQKREST